MPVQSAWFRMKCCFTVFCDLSVKFIVRWLWRKSLYARFWCCYFVNGHCREGVIHGPFFFKQHIHYCMSNALFCVDACSVNKYWAVLNLFKISLSWCTGLNCVNFCVELLNYYGELFLAGCLIMTSLSSSGGTAVARLQSWLPMSRS